MTTAVLFLYICTSDLHYFERLFVMSNNFLSDWIKRGRIEVKAKSFRGCHQCISNLCSSLLNDLTTSDVNENRLRNVLNLSLDLLEVVHLCKYIFYAFLILSFVSLPSQIFYLQLRLYVWLIKARITLNRYYRVGQAFLTCLPV